MVNINQDKEKEIFQEEDNNVNLEFINEKLLINFQKQLSEVKVVEKYFRNTSKEVKPWFSWFSSPYNEIYYHANFNFDKLFKYEYKRNGSYSVDARINVHQLLKFLSDIENEVKEKSEEVFNQQLINNENKYFALFNNIKEEYKYREESLKRELQIINDSSLEIINNYDLLVQKSSSFIKQREEIIRQNGEIQNWENKYNSMFALWEIASVDLGIAVVEISSLTNSLKNKSSQLESFKVSLNQKHQKLIDEFFISCNLRDEIQRIKNDLGEEIKILTTSSNVWKKKYEESTLNLNFRDNQFKELQRVHFWMKLKLSTVLALDSARIVMPIWCNDALTLIETGIFTGQLINSKIEKTFWISASAYFLLSIVFTTYKFSKFTIFTFVKLWKKINQWLNNEKNDWDYSFDFEEKMKKGKIINL